ncbi:MAG: hypothetical protein ACKOQ6_05875 [Bacteroidota bacterium]
MKEFLYILLIAFILFGFLRRFIYFQAYSSFTKAAQDFQKRNQRPMRPEGTVTIEKAPQNLDKHNDSEYVDYEEVK